YRKRPGRNWHEYSPTYAHNCYIQMAAEVGLLGLGCFLWILGKFFKNIFRAIWCGQRKDRDNSLVILLIGLVTGASGFLLHSFVDTHFYSLKLSVLSWFMIGLAVAAYNLLSSSRNCDIKET
ncbi:MAG: hypothetical protein NT079_04520, partial [Candidatus Omnitrophica bacterium]|nr:hypothetical protein [Candidatus Omnitrophota bacterium]